MWSTGGRTVAIVERAQADRACSAKQGLQSQPGVLQGDVGCVDVDGDRIAIVPSRAAGVGGDRRYTARALQRRFGVGDFPDT
ncbi:MAG: hypothetical protein DLM64_02525 [Solirubrobacterales bacterium]|nr:MAG: hypothetical protein DLM64_02525 [Solirubrobacterales bacterium]